MNRLVIRIWAGVLTAVFASGIFTQILVIHYFEFFFHDPDWYPLKRTAWIVQEILGNTPTERIEAERLYLSTFLNRSISVYPARGPTLPKVVREFGPDAAPVYLTATSGKSFYYAPLHDGTLIVSIDPAVGLYKPMGKLIDRFIVFFVPVLMTIPIGIFLSRSANRRIRNLERSVRQIAEGDTTARICAVRGDPLGSVEDCFNQMADFIHRMVQAQHQRFTEFVAHFQTGLKTVRGILETKADTDFRAQLERIHYIVEDLERFVSRLLRSERNAHNTTVKADPVPSDGVRHRLSAFAFLTGFRSYEFRAGTLRFMFRLAGGILLALLLNHLSGLFVSQVLYRYLPGTPDWYPSRVLTGLVQHAVNRAQPDAIDQTIATLGRILDRNIERVPAGAIPPLGNYRLISAGNDIRYGTFNGRKAYFAPLESSEQILVLEPALHLYRINPSLFLHLAVIPLEFLLTVIGTYFLSVPIVLSFRELETGIDLLRRDRLDTRIQIPAHDPVGTLADCLNEMADRVQALISNRRHLLHAVAHEVRTPISRIFYYLETDAEPFEKVDPSQLRILIMEETTELEKLILELSIYLSGKDIQCDVPAKTNQIVEMLDEVSSYYQRVAPKLRFTVLASQPSDVSFIEYPPELKRVLHNVLSNAARYADKSVEVFCGADQKEIFITIGDDGPGIPEDKREAVFEPFRRLDASRNRKSGGFGLGLAIARRIITDARGKIVISDNSPGGTKVTITLPRKTHPTVPS